MSIKHISIIGGGNLGVAIAEGIRSNGHFEEVGVTVTKRDIAPIASLQDQRIHISSNNCEAAVNADVIIIAVQPSQVKDVLKEIKNEIFPNKVVVSVATGFSIEQVEDIIGSDIPIFRCMPNTAVAVKESMTCITCNSAGKEKEGTIQNIFAPLGETAFIEEELFQAATVLGASGIAFWMRFIRATTQGGIQMGFESDVAQKIAMQTCLGAATLLKKHHSHPEAEIDRVTTPQGCTITGLNEMEHHGLSSALIKGLLTSFAKINEIKESQIK